jgi:hypothetical protein
VWCDGHHPATCVSATHSERDGHDEQHCFGIRHRPHGARSNWSTIILAVAAVAESDGLSSFAATSRKRRHCAGSLTNF